MWTWHINNCSEMIELRLQQIRDYWGECRRWKDHLLGELLKKGTWQISIVRRDPHRGVIILRVVSNTCLRYTNNSKQFFPEFISQTILAISELLPNQCAHFFLGSYQTTLRLQESYTKISTHYLGVNIKLYWHLHRDTNKQNRLF